jgi:protocatechuate 3,4-dioxygenase beta subunit
MLFRVEPVMYGYKEAPSPKATTDEEGRFKLSNLPAGRYRVDSYTPTLVSPSSKPNAPTGTEVILADGEEVEGIDLDLARGGVVTGRVVDGDGKPVVNLQIMLLAEGDDDDESGAVYNVSNSGNGRTDDRGIYRIYGVAPGRYFVWAGQNPNFRSVSPPRSEPAYPLTYYPGVGDKSLAKPVEIKADGESAGIDFALARRKKAFTVRGRVIGENDKPVPNLMIGYGQVRSGSSYFGGINTSGNRSDNDGNFTITSVVPERYGFFAFPDRDSGLFSDVSQVEITDSDVAGIEIRVHRGLSIQGTVIVEGSNDPELNSKLSSLALAVYALWEPDVLMAPSGGQIRVGVDGSFVVNGLRPGKVNIVLQHPGRKTFSINRVEVDGVSYSDGVQIEVGQNLSGVKVVLAHAAFVISGVIQVEGVEVPADTGFWITVRRPGTVAGATMPVRADARRRFRIEGLPAGEYDIYVSPFGTSDSVYFPPGQKKTVTLSGNLTDLVITLNASKSKKGQQ